MHLATTRAARRTAPPALLLLAGALAACSGGSSASPACAGASDCTVPAGVTCRIPLCVQGTCTLGLAPAGTALPDPTPHDCQTLVCNALGDQVAAPADADLPVDGTTCLPAGCSGGGVTHVPAPRATACAGGLCDGAGACLACLAPTDCPAAALCTERTCQAGVCGTSSSPVGTACGSGLTCDGAGHCASACATAADCPGTDTECRTRTCAAGQCGGADAPAGTVLAAQVAGDCHRLECDGAGNVTPQVLDLDVPVDGNACTLDLCTAGAPSNPPVAAGTACPTGQCDGAGACVECLAGTDCPSGVCSAAHACLAPTCSDGVKNGAETGTDCGGPTCPTCGTDQACLAPSDCTSTYCFGGFCRADLNGCTAATATDGTALATATVTFPVGFNLAYSPPCLKVRVGTEVTFTAIAPNSFALHPLQGGYAGIPDPSSPFGLVSAGTTAPFTMSAVGEFPYYCTVHSALGMYGAIFVVP